MGAENSIAPRPSIEWPTPTINNIPGALEDLSLLIERLRALLSQNIDELQEVAVDRPCADENQTKWVFDVWMIFRLGAEKLGEVDTIVSALVDATIGMPTNPVARHTQIRRAQDFRAAVDRLNAENTSSDISDEGIDRAGDAFAELMRCRVGNLDHFREKMEIMCGNAGFVEAYADELFRDLDALGCRAKRAVQA